LGLIILLLGENSNMGDEYDSPVILQPKDSQELGPQNPLKTDLENRYKGKSDVWEEDISYEDATLFQSLYKDVPFSVLTSFSHVSTKIPEMTLDDVVILYKWIHPAEPVNFGKINQHLRERTTTPEMDQVIERIKAAFEKLPIYKGVVYRGIQSPGELGKVVKDFQAKYQEGAVIEELPFLSAAKYPEGSRGGLVRLTIDSKTARDLEVMGPTEIGEVVFMPKTNFDVKTFSLEGEALSPRFITIETSEINKQS
jgi:hypothetical protein